MSRPTFRLPLIFRFNLHAVARLPRLTTIEPRVIRAQMSTGEIAFQDQDSLAELERTTKCR